MTLLQISKSENFKNCLIMRETKFLSPAESSVVFTGSLFIAIEIVIISSLKGSFGPALYNKNYKCQ